jgi:GNAT superfamily N-acetyltransferase
LSDAVGIRDARPDDVPLLFSLIVELADYERAADRVAGSEALLHEALFGPRPDADAAIAWIEEEPAGFALFFGTFSTWLCRPGLWLEDLYVRPAYRRGGVGLALLRHVAGVAQARGCGRVEWAVLDWNSPAISFYESLGAETMHEWETMRLSGEELAAVASGR